MTPQAVVFDIGNVLLEWAPERYYDKAIGPERRRALFEEVDIEGTNLRSDLGENLQSLITDLARQHPDWEREILMFWEDWPEMASPAINGSVRLLRALRRKKLPVFALSNFGKETFDIAQRNYPFLEEFDQIFLSATYRLAKPDPSFYEALETATGYEGAALFFTDDREENIEAAAARSWQVHQFTGASGLAEALLGAGLLVEDDLT